MAKLKLVRKIFSNFCTFCSFLHKNLYIAHIGKYLNLDNEKKSIQVKGTLYESMTVEVLFIVPFEHLPNCAFNVH